MSCDDLRERDVVQRAEISCHDTCLKVLADRMDAAEAVIEMLRLIISTQGEMLARVLDLHLLTLTTFLRGRHQAVQSVLSMKGRGICKGAFHCSPCFSASVVPLPLGV